MEGFCNRETKLLGPCQTKLEPAKEFELKLSVCVTHTVPLVAETVGVGCMVTVPCVAAVQEFAAVTVT